MPIYEYQCQHCGERTELLQKVNDPPASECPHCHENKLQKLISAAGFQLKGSGWYVTDFRDKGKKPTDNNKETNTAKDSKKDET